MKLPIRALLVKHNGEVVQAEGIADDYTRVQLSTSVMKLHPELAKLFTQEAKDLVGVYGEVEIEIVVGELELT